MKKHLKTLSLVVCLLPATVMATQSKVEQSPVAEPTMIGMIIKMLAPGSTQQGPP